MGSVAAKWAAEWGGPRTSLWVDGLTVNGLTVQVGDSNTVGLGSTDHMDNGPGWQNAYANATIQEQYATGITDPMVWTTVARQNVQPYDATPGNPAVGYELAFARYMIEYGGAEAPLAMGKFAASGAKMDHFKPSSVSPANPKNLYGQLLDYLDAQIAATGKPLGVVILALGTNDAGDSTATSNFATNLSAIEAGLRAKYGSSFLLVLLRINANMTAAGTAPNRSTINTAMDAFATLHSNNCLSVTPDRIPVSNSALHYVADEQASVGNMLAEAVSEKLRPGRSWNRNAASGLAPWIQFINEPTARSSTSTGDLTVRGPARSQAGDWEYLLVGQATSAVAPALTTAAGFTAVASVQGVSTSTVNNEYLYLYERFVTQAGLNANDGKRLADPVITDNNITKQALIFSVRNAYQPATYASAIEAATLTPSNAFNTAVAAPGVTTRGTNRLVVHLQTGYCTSPNAASGWADGSLSGFALLRDSTDDTNETSAIAAGTLAAAGPSGTVTGTRAFATLMEDAVIAIRSATDPGVTATTDATSGVFVPVSLAEWNNLAMLGVPAFQWGCQDASGSLVAAFGGLNLPIGGSGQLYQQAVAGWARKAVGTPDNGTTDWVSSNAALPDCSAVSVAIQAYWLPPASNPAGNRRVMAYGTTTTFGVRVSTAGKLIFDVGANNATGTVTWTGAAVVILRVVLDKTNARAVLYASTIDGTKSEKLTVAIPGTVPTGKQLVVGGAGASAAQDFLFVDLFSGANAELSDANVKADHQRLGWAPSWV